MSRSYAALKINVYFAIDNIKEDLQVYRDNLRLVSIEFSENFSVKDSEPYGSNAQIFQSKLKIIHDQIFSSQEKRRQICKRVPKYERNRLKRVLFSFYRIYVWNRVANQINDLRVHITQHQNQIEELSHLLKILYDLPWEVSNQAKAIQNISTETRFLFDELINIYGVGGQVIRDVIEIVNDTERKLSEIPVYFYTFSKEKLVSTRDIKAETQKIYRIVSPAKASIENLYKKGNDWKTALGELHQTVKHSHGQVDDAEARFDTLEKGLEISSEKEELETLRQSVNRIQLTLQSITIENLNVTVADAKQTLTFLENLNKVLLDYEEKLKKLGVEFDKVTERYKTIDDLMRRTAARPDNPVIWTTSKMAIGAVERNLQQILPLSQCRTPAQLKVDLDVIGDCNNSTVKLLKTVVSLRGFSNDLYELWKEMRVIYTVEWLQKVRHTFSQVSLYDIESNWNKDDFASTLLSDAEELMKRVKENMPASLSIPIYEQSVETKLLNAKELVAKKSDFDKRAKNIQDRLRTIQESENFAQQILNRTLPSVVQFSQDIRKYRLEIRPAQRLLDIERRAKSLDETLKKRNFGKVERVVRETQGLEKEAINNGKLIFQWSNKVLRDRREKLTVHLKEIRKFADDLEDELINKARQYELVFVPHHLTVEGLQQIPLVPLQEGTSKLLEQGKLVIDADHQLVDFINPVKEEYDKLFRLLKNLRATCSKLQREFKRGWPPVFQSLRKLEMEIKIIEQDIQDLNKRTWRKRDLMKKYHSVKSEMRRIRLALEEKKEKDKKDVEEINTLVEEYRRVIREHANKQYDGDTKSIAEAIQVGNKFLDDFLPRAYQKGVPDENGFYKKWSPAQIRSHLKKVIHTKKQQIINFDRIHAHNITVNQKMD